MTMLEGLIGKKIGITQSFDEGGNVFPVTVIQAGPCTVFQKKTEKKDGYSSVQIGLIEEKGRKNTSKPLAGHCEKAGVPPPKILREFRFLEQADVKVGDQFFADIFEKGEEVHITGRSKGKGFAGVVKRWGYHGGKGSHGSMFHRRPGSIGASAYPSRVVKGKKLPGHLGDNRVTVRNLTVVRADKENNLLVVKGSIPGANGGYLLIKKAHFEPAAVPPKPKPSEDKKAEDKKAEDKKVEDKKVEGKKVEAETEIAEGKKAEEKKPEEKTAEAKKTEDKKTKDPKVEDKKTEDKD
jgi:large subunit ribosomal protein L3